MIAVATLVTGLVALTAGAPAKAEIEYPYCTSGGWSTDGNCSFSTLQQCQAYVQGVGGSCVQNPRVSQYPQGDAQAGSRRVRRY
jgi:hypothetical protein